MNAINSLDWLTEQLGVVVNQGFSLLRRIGFDECLEIYYVVDADEEDPNTSYRLKAMNQILLNIYEAHASLDFLRRRESMEVHTMSYFPSVKRYGYYSWAGQLVEFHCGHPLEALIADNEGKQHWEPTRIEYSNSKGGYYLVGHGDVSLDGLLVRDGG